MLTTCSSSVRAAAWSFSTKATSPRSSPFNDPPCPAIVAIVIMPTVTAAVSNRIRSLYAAHLASEQGHRTEDRLAELSGIHTDRPFQVIGQRLPVGGTPDDVGQAREVREADGQVDRHDRLFTGAQGQPEREIDVRRAR